MRVTETGWFWVILRAPTAKKTERMVDFFQETSRNISVESQEPRPNAPGAGNELRTMDPSNVPGFETLPGQPTDAPPGSEQKIRVLTERASRRESLFHPLDGRRTIRHHFAKPGWNGAPHAHRLTTEPAPLEAVAAQA
jgi:hypothetical protein